MCFFVSAAAGGVFPVIFFLDALRPLSVLTVSAAGGGGSGAAGCGAAGAAASCPAGVLDLALPLAFAFAFGFDFAAGRAGGVTCSGGATTGVWFSVIGVVVDVSIVAPFALALAVRTAFTADAVDADAFVILVLLTPFGRTVPAGGGGGPGGGCWASAIMSSSFCGYIRTIIGLCLGFVFPLILIPVLKPLLTFEFFTPTAPADAGGGGGGCWLLVCETSMSSVPSSLPACPLLFFPPFPYFLNFFLPASAASLATYDWSAVAACGPKCAAICLVISSCCSFFFRACSARTFAVPSAASSISSFIVKSNICVESVCVGVAVVAFVPFGPLPGFPPLPLEDEAGASSFGVGLFPSFLGAGPPPAFPPPFPVPFGFGLKS